MALTNAYLPKLASRIFNANNQYGLGSAATTEVTANSYARRSGTLFNWNVNTATPSAPYAHNNNAVYYPELKTGEAYTANYFLVYSQTLSSSPQLIYNAQFNAPVASVTAGQQVKIAKYSAGNQRGVKVVFTL